MLEPRTAGLALCCRRREGELGLVPQRPCNGSLIQCDRRIRVQLHQGEIGVRGAELGLECGSRLIRAGVCQPSFARAEPHQKQLVVLAALELECATVSSVRENGAANITERE